MPLRGIQSKNSSAASNRGTGTTITFNFPTARCLHPGLIITAIPGSSAKLSPSSSMLPSPSST